MPLAVCGAVSIGALNSEHTRTRGSQRQVIRLVELVGDISWAIFVRDGTQTQAVRSRPTRKMVHEHVSSGRAPS
jgi:hypothetical protein